MRVRTVRAQVRVQCMRRYADGRPTRAALPAVQCAGSFLRPHFRLIILHTSYCGSTVWEEEEDNNVSGGGGECTSTIIYICKTFGQ